MTDSKTQPRSWRWEQNWPRAVLGRLWGGPGVPGRCRLTGELSPKPGEGLLHPAWPRILGLQIVESLQHLNLLPQTSVQSSQQFLAPPPQVNWGVSACNTHNEVSIALAKFNYRSICFLIFPRWLDVFFFPHNYKGTDCTVALCRRVRDSGCFFPDSSFEICQKP